MFPETAFLTGSFTIIYEYIVNYNICNVVKQEVLMTFELF